MKVAIPESWNPMGEVLDQTRGYRLIEINEQSARTLVENGALRPGDAGCPWDAS